MSSDLCLQPLNPGVELQHGRNKYIIKKVLGSGYFGIVYLADYIRPFGYDKQLVAIKECVPNSCVSREDGIKVKAGSERERNLSIEDFLKECRILKKLSGESENIVKIYDYFKANGTAYYVMEYIPGGSLERTSIENATRIIRIIAQALDEMHEMHFLHLDLKPDNILMKDTKNGERIPVLIDFGVSKQYDENGKPVTLPLAKGISYGYAPIEQSEPITEFSPAIDIYALGATFLYLITGKNPPASTSLIKPAQPELKKILDETEAPKNVRETILNAMKPSKDERTQNIRRFLRDLDHCWVDNDYILKTQEEAKGGNLVSQLRLYHQLMDIDATNELLLQDSGLYIDSTELAYQWLLLSAKNGNSEAQYELGEIYHLGGCENSCLWSDEETASYVTHERKALYWWDKAAEQGYVDAIKQICFWSNHKTEEACRTSIKWLKKLANMGYPKYQYELAYLYLHNDFVKDIQEGLNWLIKAASNGDVSAQYDLAEAHWSGDYDLGCNLELSIKWALKGALSNHEESCWLLATIYSDDVEEDIEVDDEEVSYVDIEKTAYWWGECLKFNEGCVYDDTIDFFLNHPELVDQSILDSLIDCVNDGLLDKRDGFKSEQFENLGLSVKQSTLDLMNTSANKYPEGRIAEVKALIKKAQRRLSNESQPVMTTALRDKKPWYKRMFKK